MVNHDKLSYFKRNSTGGPLSAYLFVLFAEEFDSGFPYWYANCKRFGSSITPIFVDNCLLFVKAPSLEWSRLQAILLCYERTSDRN